MKIFKCELCGEDCGGNPDAKDEAKELWGIEFEGDVPPSDVAVICDDCFKRRSPAEIQVMSEITKLESV